METKQLVDKFINGEITDAEFDEETSKLSPEDKKKLEQEAKDKMPDAVEKLKGVRRGIDKITQEKNTTFEAKVQQENLTAAKTKFYKDFGIEKAEDISAFEAGFKTESVNVENIIKDMKTRYVAMNPDKYLALEQEKKARETAAEEINSQNANGGGTGGSGGSDNTKPSKEVLAFMEASRKAGRVVTPEFAKKALDAAKNKGRIG
jgi:hypothetical protein